jgi:hypothetical protein
LISAVAVTTALAVGPGTQASAAPASPAASPNAEGPVEPALAPSGCASGKFCSYNKGNGGNLCFSTSSNVQYWSAACANHNQSAYNRYQNSINLYWGGDWYGAYAVLGSGNYWLYMDKNNFNRCPPSPHACTGYNEPTGYNVASSRFNNP